MLKIALSFFVGMVFMWIWCRTAVFPKLFKCGWLSRDLGDTKTEDEAWEDFKYYLQHRADQASSEDAKEEKP